MNNVTVVKVFTAWIEAYCDEDELAVIAVDWRNRCFLHNHRSVARSEHEGLLSAIEAKGKIDLEYWTELVNDSDAMKGGVDFSGRMNGWHKFETNVELECKHPTSFEDRCTSCCQWIN